MLFFRAMHKTATLREDFKIHAEASKLFEFRERLYRICTDEGIPPQPARLMVLAVDEAISNIIEHAKLPENDNKIGVSVEIDEHQLVVRISDRGKPFDPRPIRREPDGCAYPRRGFGLYLIQKIVNQIDYERTSDGSNMLKLTKSID